MTGKPLANQESPSLAGPARRPDKPLRARACRICFPPCCFRASLPREKPAPPFRAPPNSRSTALQFSSPIKLYSYETVNHILEEPDQGDNASPSSENRTKTRLDKNPGNFVPLV